MSRPDRHRDPLCSAVGLLRPRLPRLALAIVLGAASLIAALGLAGVSAWLITRAWQMPPILDLSVAVVTVRACAIARGVLHYCERLASHDTALRAAGSARVQLYRRLAYGPVEITTGVPSGTLVARLGADVDAFAEVLVRAVLPIAVGAVLAVIAVGVIAVISVPAAVMLALGLLIAGVIAPWVASRAAGSAEELARRHHGERDVAAVTALEHAAELRISGRLPEFITQSQRHQRNWGAATDAAAAPAAWAEAMPTAATAVSVIAAVVAGIAIAPDVAPTTLAILMLLPLSAFEATTVLPSAAIQLTRSRIAARHLLAVAPELATPAPVPTVGHPRACPTGDVRAEQLVVGHHRALNEPVTLDLSTGTRLAVTGPSGAGKTTLLMTLAGLLAPLRGGVTVDGRSIGEFAEDELRSRILFFAEDAHLFATTVRDNLLVARGDSTDTQILAALDRVGLGDWLAGLPNGLETVLDGGAEALSAGQRRRVLLARAMLVPAGVILLDEPTENLDAADSDRLLTAVLDPDGGVFHPEQTVVVATHHLPATAVVPQWRLQPARLPGAAGKVAHHTFLHDRGHDLTGAVEEVTGAQPPQVGGHR
ncbi:thiol reductant ABC exporter subunit CydC [Mycobacterium koreense]|uniref:Thiol reductant ABC exporter subunit CydC n=1 Tax=Mycolicibacillus koreensis TaxID=1069220 RepID=A0A7I7SCC9_9MYCO|nr:thiol reductant ABC exporter subunit CydC [Mycolicibacillus koreensis]OSC36055.1 thiol reductant ABC exporter subunit CydC [Mycolicibacillus koreensis]BBY53675.1 thiol reductant ABC exporter subunit CydC [Mycolicibacillus koreensis]